jgi:hypothetical protein
MSFMSPPARLDGNPAALVFVTVDIAAIRFCSLFTVDRRQSQARRRIGTGSAGDRGAEALIVMPSDTGWGPNGCRPANSIQC